MIHVRIVYDITADFDAARVRADCECLSPEERARAERFVFDADRRDYVAAHTLLRRTLTTIVPRDPASWSFLHGDSGKPRVAEADLDGNPIAFNLSHTRGLVACVVARGGDVGIDVERVPDGDDVLEVARTRYSIAEMRDLERPAGAERRERFAELWTLKEAQVKATGAGIAGGAALPSFLFGPGNSLQLAPDSPADGHAWTFALFAVRHWRLAVAIRANEAIMMTIVRAGSDPTRGDSDVRLLRASHGASIAMGGVSRIDVTLDRKALNIVLETFSFMRDHWGEPGIVDPAALFISQQDAADLVARLNANDRGGDRIVVTMNFDDWVVYGTLLLHTSSNIPQSDPDAYEVLDALRDEVGRRDDAGEAPSGPGSR